MSETVRSRGTVTIATDRCKGCELCIPACPPDVLMSTDVNRPGSATRSCTLSCTGLAACLLVCPDFVFEVFRYETPVEHSVEPTVREGDARERALMEGSEALVRASLLSGCRFFAGYPMTPFTEILEHFAELMPDGGSCINAESELEPSAWRGARRDRRPGGDGLDRSGLSLMQESLSEATLAEVPLVVFNMARSQGDYFQATRGGHGDYRNLVLAPQDVREGIELAARVPSRRQVAQPRLVYGDYLLTHTQESVAIEPPRARAAAEGVGGEDTTHRVGRLRSGDAARARQGRPA